MSALAEAMIAAFDSKTRLTWTTRGMDTAIATFTHNGLLVTTTFTKVGETEWQVGFTAAPDTKSVTSALQASIRIFSGVFQAVREFLEVRQPNRLVLPARTRHSVAFMRPTWKGRIPRFGSWAIAWLGPTSTRWSSLRSKRPYRLPGRHNWKT